MRVPVARTAAVAASLVAADVVVLTLFLNPQAPHPHQCAARLVGLFLPYALAGTALLTLLALLASWLLGERPARGLVLPGLPFFVVLVGVSLTAGCLLFGSNLMSYRYSIPAPCVRGLLGASVAMGAAVLVLVGVAIDALLFPRHDRGPAAAVAVLAAASGVVVPLALVPAPVAEARPVPLATERVPPSRRVMLVGVDGLGPRELREAVARGAAPALNSLLRRGAHGPLGTLRPTEGPPLWTTAFTGRLPRHHGIKSFVSYRLRASRTTFDLLPKWALVGALERVGLVRTHAVTSAQRGRRALWNILGAFGLPSGIVRFWGTYPAERVQGFMLSHTFHQLLSDPTALANALQPPDLLPEVRARAVAARDVEQALVAEFLEPSVAAADPWRRLLVEQALAPDLTYWRAGGALRQAYDPSLYALSFEGLDVVGHAFLRFDRPELFGDVSQEEARRYGRVRERYLELVARSIGEQAQALQPGDVLLVVSAYGMEPVPLWRRLLWPGRRSGTHVGGPDGVLLAMGEGIRPGATISSASILDLTPTILYLMGLPVARDMEGRVLTELFSSEFVRAHPLTFIPSYESLAVTPLPARDVPEVPPLEAEQ